MIHRPSAPLKKRSRFSAFCFVALLSFLALQFGCSKKPDTLVTGGYDQKEMDQAIAKARSTIDGFIQELTAKTGEDHGVKAPITENGETEHFWLTDVTFDGTNFHGKIGNDPGIVKNVKLGQDWTIKKNEVSDWMYFKDKRMYGNYTMRPLLKTLPKEEADLYRMLFAEP